MANPFKKVAFTCYPVTNLERSRKFYEQTLGLKPGENFHGTWQEYDLGGTTFAICSAITEFLHPGTQGAVAFEVDDIKLLVEELRAKGVEFVPPQVMDGDACTMAFFRDPDGNKISLHQLK